MPIQPVPEDLMRVQITHELADGPELATNTLHLRLDRRTGDATNWAAHVQECANKVFQKYTAEGRPNHLISDVARLVRVSAYHLRASDGLTIHKADAQGIPIGGIAGRGTGNVLPYDQAVVVSLRTLEEGEALPDPETGASPLKRSRGRIFFGPISANFLTGQGRLTPTARDAIANSWQTSSTTCRA